MTTSKYTVVFYLVDAWGHIQPILSIAKELQRRGHKVIILTCKYLTAAQNLKSRGFEVDYCLPPTDEDDPKHMKTLFASHVQRFRLSVKEAFKTTYEIDGIVDGYLKRSIEAYDCTEAKLKSLKPDLIIYDNVIGCPLVHTAAPKWVRIYSSFPSVLFSSLNENFVAGLGLKLEEMPKWKEFERIVKSPIRKKVVEHFKDKGSPEWPLELELSPTSPYLNFYYGPQELGLERLTFRDDAGIEQKFKPLSDSWFRLEHTIDESLSDELALNLPEAFEKLPGKTIYFSLGTLASYDFKLINRLLDIMGRNENKFIVSMGPMSEAISLHPNMWGSKFVNQFAALRKADLFLTHAGHNSIIEAFYFGVPCLVMPVLNDQFDLAQQVENCGFGIRLDPYKCTDIELLEAIESMLSNQELKHRMQAASARMKSIKYYEIAANKLEALVANSLD